MYIQTVTPTPNALCTDSAYSLSTMFIHLIGFVFLHMCLFCSKFTMPFILCFVYPPLQYQIILKKNKINDKILLEISILLLMLHWTTLVYLVRQDTHRLLRNNKTIYGLSDSWRMRNPTHQEHFSPPSILKLKSTKHTHDAIYKSPRGQISPHGQSGLSGDERLSRNLSIHSLLKLVRQSSKV